jgi:DNA gyrase subunit A
LVVANKNIDTIIKLIKSSKDSKEAKEKLMKSKWKLSDSDINYINLIGDQTNTLQKNTYSLTETQTKAILELRLHRLTSLERDDIKKDLENII